MNYSSSENIENSDINKPLHNAVKEENLSLVKKLLDQGNDVNGYCNDRAPIHIAAQSLNTNMLDLLLDNGANLEARDNEGKTAAHHMVSAIRHTNFIGEYTTRVENLKTLLSRYLPDVTIIDNKGYSPLSYFVFLDKADFINTLDGLVRGHREKITSLKMDTFYQQITENFSRTNEEIENIGRNMQLINLGKNNINSQKEINLDKYKCMDINEMAILYKAYIERIELYERKLQSNSSFCDIQSRAETVNKLAKFYTKSIAISDAAKARGIENLINYKSSSNKAVNKASNKSIQKEYN